MPHVNNTVTLEVKIGGESDKTDFSPKSEYILTVKARVKAIVDECYFLDLDGVEFHFGDDWVTCKNNVYYIYNEGSNCKLCGTFLWCGNEKESFPGDYLAKVTFVWNGFS